jgi:hypothetical protein
MDKTKDLDYKSIIKYKIGDALSYPWMQDENGLDIYEEKLEINQLEYTDEYVDMMDTIDQLNNDMLFESDKNIIEERLQKIIQRKNELRIAIDNFNEESEYFLKYADSFVKNIRDRNIIKKKHNKKIGKSKSKKTNIIRKKNIKRGNNIKYDNKIIENDKVNKKKVISDDEFLDFLED